LCLIDIASGRSRAICEPRDQIGWPCASPSGNCLAFVEALCSDRWFVAGDLYLIDPASGEKRRIDTNDIDVSHTEWRSETVLLIAGHRHWESVVAIWDVVAQSLTEVWSSTEVTTPGLFISVAGFGSSGDCALIGEGFAHAPEIATLRGGRYRRLRSLALDDGAARRVVGSIDRPAWQAPDGQRIEGWLLSPATPGPHPVVMAIHGGPVGHWRPLWLGRRNVLMLALLERGYAIFLPNPRGSAGYGQEFARGVLGDMAGADTHDYLSGLDALVDRGLVDPRRVGVMGVSYGGFMSCWLVTQDTRFAAAVPVAPVSNHVTQQLVSNIPEFVSLFLEDAYDSPGGKYFTRSPVMYASRVRTPTLNVCGALDRCTPAVEAVQFHNALLQNGVKSVLLTYPEEGHGIRKLPAAIDYTARVLAWFEAHMGGAPKRNS
jgi:dipeptidyl aminopeptidase/acylaminoacyl peptidase